MSAILIIAFFLFWLAAGWVVGLIVQGRAGSGGTLGAIAFAALAVAGILWSIYGGAGAVLGMAGAHPADPRRNKVLHDVVEELAIGDGLPKPEVYVVDDPSPNAFATGRDPQHAAVTVTTGLLDTMDRRELQAVLAHEMSHIKNLDVRLLLILSTLIGLAGLIASFVWNSMPRVRLGGRNGGGYIILVIFAVGLVFTVVAFVVGPLMQLALSRDRESLADASGVQLTRDPEGLIGALRKLLANSAPPERFNHTTAAMWIDNPEEHHGNWFSRFFDTHPPIEDRIAALERMLAVKET
jgi:heat shock protein HtpX